MLFVIGAVGFFVTNQRDARQDRQQVFEAAESARFPQGFRYIALNVKREDAHRLRGVAQGPVKNVYFVRLPDGSIHTEGSRKRMSPVQITFVPGQAWSVLIFQGQQLLRYRVQLDQTTYRALLTAWF